MVVPGLASELVLEPAQGQALEPGPVQGQAQELAPVQVLEREPALVPHKQLKQVKFPTAMRSKH